MLIIVRLQESIDAVCPGANVQLRSGEYSLDFAGTETAQQRTAAQAALAAFDWSQAAHDAWVVTQMRAKSLTELVNSKDETIVLLRGVVEAMGGLLNKQFIWDGQFKTALANSATFAAFKAAMASISAPPVVSKADMRQGIVNEISAGKADA